MIVPTEVVPLVTGTFTIPASGLSGRLAATTFRLVGSNAHAYSVSPLGLENVVVEKFPLS